ncbi:MAG: DUF1598 domain-containing protein [Planctomycetota bacterium]
MDLQRHLVAVALIVVTFTSSASGQNGGGGGGNGNGGFPGGILISPNGLVNRVNSVAVNAAALRQLRNHALKALNEDLNQPSDRRFVSLAGLDEAIARQLAANESLSADMKFLAGLSRIDFVIVEEHDVILAGPASGFASSPDGRIISVESGRPVLNLDDLLVALRGASEENHVGCSMDPDIQRLQQAMDWLKANSAPATPADARARMQRSVELQGEWTVSTFGVPETSRMCLAMVEADYLMKRIAIGSENPGVRGLRSSLALARPNDNMMRRWWFTPCYTLDRTEDARVFAFSGPRLQLHGREELINDAGQVIEANLIQPSSEKFARLFSDRIDQLAEKVPAFADLQNIFDLLTAGAILNEAESSGRLNWTLRTLRDQQSLSIASYSVPRTTLPEVNTKDAGSLIIGAFSGGVTIRPANLTASASLKGTSKANLQDTEVSDRRRDQDLNWPTMDVVRQHAKSDAGWWDAMSADAVK